MGTSSPQHAAGLRVLIADDESVLRSALSDLVSEEPDLEVVGVAKSADEAAALAERTQPDIALVDVRMPGGGGVAAARGIRERSPSTRILALSAYDDRASALELLGNGAVGYLLKGVAPDEIVDAIRRAARGQASMAADVAAGLVEDIVRHAEPRRGSQNGARPELDPHPTGSGPELAGQAFRALIDTAPDAVVIADAGGTIVYANQQVVHLFGYSSEEIVGETLELLVPERFRGRHLAHRAEYARAPAARPMGSGLELAGLRKDGTEFPVDVSLSSLQTEQGLFVIGFVRDVTERVSRGAFERELAGQRAVLEHVVSAAEDERQRIANDIHDDSIQAITAAGIRLQLLRRALQAPEPLALLDELAETLQLSISRLRSLLFELRPPSLDLEGLSAALRAYLEQVRALSETTFRLDNRLTTIVPTKTRLVLYRIAQEALTNVRKHADAKTTVVLLEERDGGYQVRITDDGAGFDTTSVRPAPGHLGLSAMRERAELAGGRLRIESAPGEGTTVEVWMPILAEDGSSRP